MPKPGVVLRARQGRSAVGCEPRSVSNLRDMPQPKGRRAPSSDLHGNAPDSCPVALLLVDVINEFAFHAGDKLARSALSAAQGIASLRLRARRSHVPCVFANDN